MKLICVMCSGQAPQLQFQPPAPVAAGPYGQPPGPPGPGPYAPVQAPPNQYAPAPGTQPLAYAGRPGAGAGSLVGGSSGGSKRAGAGAGARYGVPFDAAAVQRNGNSTPVSNG